jgi:hypothetical protein
MDGWTSAAQRGGRETRVISRLASRGVGGELRGCEVFQEVGDRKVGWMGRG